MDEEITFKVTMTKAHAAAYAQFLKRVGHSDYLNNAVDSDEAYRMLYAGEAIRSGLADSGYAPR